MTPPQASITGGPAQGGFIKDPTPSFGFAAVGPTDAGSTFVCRVDAGTYKPCSPPYTTPALSNGSHLFYLQAIDAPGNESQIVWRTFTVDTQPPQTTITAGPSGSTTDATPTFSFTSSESGSTFRCRFDSQPFAACSGSASHTPQLRGPGHRQGEQRRPDARQAHIHGRSLRLNSARSSGLIPSSPPDGRY